MVKRKILTALEKPDNKKKKKSLLSLSDVCYVSRGKEKLIKIFKRATVKKKKEKIQRDFSQHLQESGNQSGRKLEYNGTGNENEEASEGFPFLPPPPSPFKWGIDWLLQTES